MQQQYNSLEMLQALIKHRQPNSTMTEVETELKKMTIVVQEMEEVLHAILRTQSYSKLVSQKILKPLLDTLHNSIAALNKFHVSEQSKRPTSRKNNGISKISECEDEEDEEHRSYPNVRIHSESSESQLFQSRISILNDDTSILKNRNQELSNENQYLTGQLSEAKRYIERIKELNQQLNKGLLSGVIIMSKSSSEREMELRGSAVSIGKEKRSREREEEFIKEIEELREELKDAQEWNVRSSNQFVQRLQVDERAIQRKTEEIWKLEGIIKNLQGRVDQKEEAKGEQEFMIDKLKEQNFRLEVALRNLKATSTPIKTDRSQKQFEKMLRERVSTAISLDIQGAFKKKP